MESSEAKKNTRSRQPTVSAQVKSRELENIYCENLKLQVEVELQLSHAQVQSSRDQAELQLELPTVLIPAIYLGGCICMHGGERMQDGGGGGWQGGMSDGGM